MKPHQVIFEKTENLLKKHLGAKLSVEIEKHSDGYEETHITIADTDIWISCNDRELTIGSPYNHRHFNPEYDNMKGIVDDLFNLLTQRKKITEYYKGNICYKIKTEIDVINSNYKELSTTLTWFFPFWKLTKEKVYYEKSLIDKVDVFTEINEMKNF